MATDLNDNVLKNWYILDAAIQWKGKGAGADEAEEDVDTDLYTFFPAAFVCICTVLLGTEPDLRCTSLFSEDCGFSCCMFKARFWSRTFRGDKICLCLDDWLLGCVVPVLGVAVSFVLQSFLTPFSFALLSLLSLEARHCFFDALFWFSTLQLCSFPT